MNDAQLDHFQNFIRLFSLLMIIAPICFYAVYWVYLTPQPPSNGRNRYWYTLYAVAAVAIVWALLR